MNDQELIVALAELLDGVPRFKRKRAKQAVDRAYAHLAAKTELRGEDALGYLKRDFS
jgi:hypothetical protein